MLFKRRSEVESLVSTLASGEWQWITAAFAVQVLHYVLQARLYQCSFGTVEVTMGLRDLLTTVAGSTFVNVVAPLAGTSGSALFVDSAARRGQSPARAAAGTLLALIAGFGTFLIILVFGFVGLSARSALTAYQIAAGGWLIQIIVLMGGALLLGLWSPRLLRGILSGVERAVNFSSRALRREPVLRDGWADDHADEYIDAAHSIRRHPRQLLQTLNMGLLGHITNIACIWALFLAYGQSASFEVIAAGYAVGMLFWIVSPVPEGLGIVEGVMTVAYSSMGVQKALAIALAFRALSFWLQLFAGCLLLRRVGSFRRDFGMQEAA